MAGRGGAGPPAAARAVPREGAQGASQSRPRRHGARRLRIRSCQKGDRRRRPRLSGRDALTRAILGRMTVTIWHNPRCSKSRQTLELLNKKGIEPTIREYLKEP